MASKASINRCTRPRRRASVTDFEVLDSEYRRSKQFHTLRTRCYLFRPADHTGGVAAAVKKLVMRGTSMWWLCTEHSRSHFALGPDEAVSRVKLTRLLNGQDPVNRALIRRSGPNGTFVGSVDATVSPAPKSLSVQGAV